MKTQLKQIKSPSDIIPMPAATQPTNCLDMELQNLYAHISWLKQRVEQLEQHLNNGEPL